MPGDKYRVDSAGNGGSLREQGLRDSRDARPTSSGGPISFAATPRGEVSLRQNPVAFNNGAGAAHKPPAGQRSSSRVGAVLPGDDPSDAAPDDFIIDEGFYHEQQQQQQRQRPARPSPPPKQQQQYDAPSFPQETPRHMQEAPRARHPPAPPSPQQQQEGGDGGMTAEQHALTEAQLRKARAGGRALHTLPFQLNLSST